MPLLHEQHGDEGDEATASSSAADTDAKIEHHLSHLESYLEGAAQGRIEEVRQILDGELPDGIAERNHQAGEKTGQATVAAGRLLEAAQNITRAAGQIYALAAKRDRMEDESTDNS